MTAPFAITGLDHVVLRVRGVDAMVRFYRDVLGCPVEKEQPAFGLIQIRAGGSLIDAVARACRRGVAVAITSRVPGGHARPTYGPGADLVAAGAVMVPRLRAGRARVLLMAALGAGLPVESTVSRWG